jgi:hypothetical protein
MNSLGKVSTPLIQLGESKSFTVFGKSFLKVTAVYLSGHPYENTTLYNPFSGVSKLSAQNPEFYALKLDSSQYKINANRSFTINVPPPTRLGNIDVILQNEGGWGNLSRFVIRNTINPYPLNHPLRSFWSPYEKPWKDGILVTV